MATPALNPRTVRERRARAETSEPGQAFLITWQGQTLPVFPGERTAADAAEFRQQTGLSLASMIATLGDEQQMDTDVIAAVVWLALRHNTEPKVRFTNVATLINDGNVDTVVDVTAIGDEDDPGTLEVVETLEEDDAELPKASDEPSGPPSRP